MTQIENALVRHQVAMPLIKDRKKLLQAAGDVVSVEDRDFSRLCQAIPAHEPDVNPGYNEDAGAAPWRGGDGANALFAAGRNERVPGQKWRQMFGHTDGPHARAAASVRNAESLVQIQMANIRP